MDLRLELVIESTGNVLLTFPPAMRFGVESQISGDAISILGMMGIPQKTVSDYLNEMDGINVPSESEIKSNPSSVFN